MVRARILGVWGGTHVLVREEGFGGGYGGGGDKGWRWGRHACADVLGVDFVRGLYLIL